MAAPYSKLCHPKKEIFTLICCFMEKGEKRIKILKEYRKECST
jgi:hypothetical protein